jgi:hypothetical protein
LSRVLPFPRKFDVLHDLWIGIINSITNGKTLYLDQPLVQYRRHSGSVTAGKLSGVRQLATRLHLLAAATDYWITDRLRGRAGA